MTIRPTLIRAVGAVALLGLGRIVGRADQDVLQRIEAARSDYDQGEMTRRNTTKLKLPGDFLGTVRAFLQHATATEGQERTMR